jgi:hypothetical protein
LPVLHRIKALTERRQHRTDNPERKPSASQANSTRADPAFAAAREIVQAGPAPACGTAFTDVQESALASGPEAVETGGCRDQPHVAGLVEVVPR